MCFQKQEERNEPVSCYSLNLNLISNETVEKKIVRQKACLARELMRL